MQLIGQGMFTKAYRKNKTRVLLKSIDPIKECMSLGGFPPSRLFPIIDRIGTELYEMKYYPKVTSLKGALDTKDYLMYKELRALSISYQRNPHDSYNAWKTSFSKLKTRRLKEALLGALDAITNYGSDIGFEISPRNVAVNNGKLVLLDCFYLISALNKHRESDL